MATLATLIKIGADISDLQSKSSQAVHALDSMEKNTTKVGAAFSTMGKALVASLSVAAISNAVRSFTDLTSELTDLAAKTGISTTALQKLKFAAEQNGGTLDGVTRSIGFMSKALFGDSKAAVPALDRLGLSINELRQMQPDEAFAAIGDAIGKIPNPMEQAALAMKLFGKAGADNLPMMKGNLRETMLAAERLGIVLDEETVKAGDDFGDSMAVLVSIGRSLIGQVLKPVLPMLTELAKVFADIGGTVSHAVVKGFKLMQIGMAGLAKEFFDSFIAISEFANKVPILGKAFGSANQENLAWAKTMSATFGAVMGDLMKETPKAASTIKKFGDEFPPVAERGRDTGRALREMADAAVDLVNRGIKAANEAMREQLMVYTAALSPLRQMILATRELGGVLLVLPPIERDWIAANNETTATLQAMVAAGMHQKAVTEDQISKFLEVNEKTVTWRDSLTELAQAMTQLSQTASNGLVSALASITNGINVGVKAVDSFKEGFDKLTSGGGIKSILSGFTGIVSGIGGIVSAAQAAISIGKALFGLFDRDKGRDLVEEFAAGFGGFESLHRELRKLGDAVGEQLWIKLTQGVGRNNAEQARAAIDEVRRALEALGTSAQNFPGITIPVDYEGIEAGIASTTPRGPLEENSFAGGSGGIRDFGQGTMAMLHGREGVYTEDQIAALSRTGDGGDIVIHHQTVLDGKIIDERIETVGRRHLQTGRWRPRAAAGRGY